MAPGSRFGRKSPLAHFGPAGKLFLAPAIPTAHHNRSCRPTTAGGLVNRRFILATALFIPALAFVSCKDDGNSNPVEPQANNPQAPTSAARSTKVYQLKVPEMSAQAKAAASKIDASQQELTTTTTTAKHDPTLLLGMA